MHTNGIDWITGMLDPERFALSSTKTADGHLLALEHRRTGLKAELAVGPDAAAVNSMETMSTLCGMLAKTFTDAKLHETGKHEFAKQVRCFYANQLIEVISQHGRCFFYNAKNDRVAQLVYDGTVYLIDEKSGNKVVLRTNGSWAGFGHGGTLRDLVTMMRDYVMKGDRIGMHFIGIQRTFGKGNIWGYPEDQMEACRAAARLLPITIEKESERAA